MRKGIRRIFVIFAMLLAYMYITSQAEAAREYTPVDQLGRGAASLPVPQRAAHPRKSSAPAKRTPLSYVTPTGKLMLFGTVEFQRPLNSLPGWLDVLKRNKADPIFMPQKYFRKITWEQFRQNASAKSPMDQLRYVNSFWNAWPYREDMANWGRADYWAIPAEFLGKSGDCEDYAITKYFTLKELGFDPQKMRIVVLRDTVRNLGHAVLAVYLDNDIYILDNLSNIVLSHKRLGNYVPEYSINEYGRWAHLRPKR